MTKETKLGMFVFVGIFSFILTVMVLGDFQLQRRYTINILFSDIAGLPTKAKVKIAGVEVGTVREISLDGDKAKVACWINRGIVLHDDSRASIVATGIIGSKYLELTTGSSAARVLAGGDTITGLEPVSFDKLISDTMEQVGALVKSFQGTGGRTAGENIAESLDNLREITGTLKHALADQETKVVNIVGNIDRFTGDMAEITADNKEDLRAAIKDIRSFSQKMDSILAKIDSGEGTIGTLLTDKEMGVKLKETISELKDTAHSANQTLRRINLIQTDWDYRLRYDTTEGMPRHDAGLFIRPREGKYYYVGGSNLGDASSSVYDSQKMNTINVLLGRQWGVLDGYAGLMRSRAGVGMKVRPLRKTEPWSRVEVVAEGFDFQRGAPYNTPFYNVGARVQVTKWGYLGAQQEDISGANHSIVYGSVLLRDDDIAYLLGLVGLARP